MPNGNKKFYDSTAAIQLIGCALNNPSLLTKTDVYNFREDDFANDFHRIVFGALYNLVNNGTRQLSTKTIENYLMNHDKSYAIFKANNGIEWLKKVYTECEPTNIDFYYSRLKKMTLLRAYDAIGLDLSWIYDPDNITDIKAKQEQMEKFDEMSLQELAETIDNRVHRVIELFVENDINESCKMSDDIDGLLRRLEHNPVTGAPLYDVVLDKIAMGARRGTFYLRSASTGVGKSRSAMADACYMSCSEIFENGQWIKTPIQNNVLFISVELDKEELQTMALSFIAGVPENHIIENHYDFQEWDRIVYATEILKEANLFIEYLPDYSMKDIENCITRNYRENKCAVCFLDYITSSMRIIEEITRASGGMKIREDQILFLLSSKIKDIASKREMFIFSATQTNAAYKTEKIPDQTLLAGAKSIANRIDFGSIMLDCTPEDLEDIVGLTDKYGVPNVKLSIYKNRRGKINRVLLWMHADKGTCRYKTMFVTDYAFNLIPLEEIGLGQEDLSKTGGAA